MEGNHSELISNFMAITGAEAAAADVYLEATNWNLEEAVNMYMETGGDLPAVSNTRAQSAQTFGDSGASVSSYPGGGGSSSSSYQPSSYMDAEPAIRAPDPSKRQRLVDDTYMMPGGNMRSFEQRAMTDAFRDFAAEGQRLMEMGMGRTPLLSAGFGAQQEHNSMATLFQPPVQLLYHGTFQQARQAGKREGKWVLVNIQSQSEFPSYMLNRDTWSHDVLKNLIQSSCIFWQNYDNTDEGRKYCTLYQVQGDDLPHIAIIDPRTGEKVIAWAGFADPEVMIERITDFCGKHTIFASSASNSAAAAPPSSSSKNSIAPSTSRQAAKSYASEDEQLAAAIAASLEDNGKVVYDSDVEMVEELPPASSSRVTSKSNRNGRVLDLTESEDIEEAEEEVPLPAEEVDVEPLPEPEASTPDTVRLQLRLADGQRVVRRFVKTEPVSALFALVKQKIPEGATKPFELRVAYPPLVLNTMKKQTLEEAGLSGTSVMMQWT